MKFTSEDLMKAMGLQVGDRVKVKCIDEQFNETFETYEIKQQAGDTYLQSIEDGFIDSLAYLIDQDVEILPRPKRVGDMKCGEYGEHKCDSCPIRAICVSDEYNNEILYSKLELSHKFAKDQEIYDLLKTRLDKELKE